MRRTKYLALAERLAKRVRIGDYHIHKIPAERKLAEEVGVSYMTARKAIQKLVDDGLLIKLPNGSVEVNRAETAEPGVVKTQIGFLAPTWNSSEITNWELALSELSRRFDFVYRVVHFYHWDDPVIAQTIARFDCTFVLPADIIGEREIRKVVDIGHKFIILNNDWSNYGVPSINLFNPKFVQRLLDHLESLGHKRIDCLNVQPSHTQIPERIAQWKLWLDVHGVTGELYNQPVESYVEPLPAAYNLVDTLIREGKFNTKALLCITSAAAIGAIRAMADHGIRAGHDVAVCTTDSGCIQLEYTTPSITSMQEVDPKPYLSTCLRWLGEADDEWQGPLLLQPADIGIAIRESTVPDIAKQETPERILRGDLYYEGVSEK